MTRRFHRGAHLGNSTIELTFDFAQPLRSDDRQRFAHPLSRCRPALERLNACVHAGWLCAVVAACGQGAADPDDSSAPGDCSAPTFASPELETQVRIALSVRENDASLLERPLTAQDLAGLTTLGTSPNVNVSSLDGLECFTSLELLSIDAGTFDSLEPLRGLESLASIALYRSAVVDLSPIADLPRLSSLFVYEAQVSDLSPLASRSLVELGFSGNPIQNLEGLTPVDSSRGDGPGCSYFLYLSDTEMTDSDVNPFCERGWYVTWGSVSDASSSSCNYDRWESNGCIRATR